MKVYLLFLFFFTYYTSNSQEFVSNYIDTYKNISIEEMNTSGIPASITLAQGMLESNWGRSDLAINAKNHFGIKCGSKWSGESFSWEDDEYKHGKIVKSCFRRYHSVDQSFRDHSRFLQKKRYAFLFNYEINDYKSWAKGLVKAGYATDPRYAKKLILIIEKYSLFEYDYQYSPKEYIVSKQSKQKDNKVRTDKKYTYRIDYINGCKFTYAKFNDTPLSISKRVGVSLKKILKYNEGLKKKKHRFKEKDIVYLEKKKRKYFGNEDTYITSGKESLASISQKFGIKLKYLAKINKTKSKIKFRKGRTVLLKPLSKRIEWAVNTKKYINSKKYLFEEALSPKK